MKTVTDIPLYDVIQSIEEKHGSDVHMVIEALLPDGKSPDQVISLVKEEIEKLKDEIG